MSTFVNTLLPDPIDNASTREELIQERAATLNAASRIHDYVILHYRDGETHESRFVGTAAERIGHMEGETFERDGEEITPLGLDLDTDSWAAGWFDWSTLRWQACGHNAALIAQIKQRPRPVS